MVFLLTMKTNKYENNRICKTEFTERYDMKNLNELYTKVDTWYKKEDQNLLKVLHSGNHQKIEEWKIKNK